MNIIVGRDGLVFISMDLLLKRQIVVSLRSVTSEQNFFKAAASPFSTTAYLPMSVQVVSENAVQAFHFFESDLMLVC